MQLHQTGTILLDRYQIEKPLGFGGQAVVYLATHLGLGRNVAVKTIRLDQKDDLLKTLLKRFDQEAKILAQLRDPHVITLHDYGTMPTGELFMVFEYIDGHDLKTILETNGPLSPAQTVPILKQVLSALDEAHSMGVLHRDIKPANIMLFEHQKRPNQVKVLDFGVAKIMMEGAQITNADNIVGTPRFLAPELIRKEALTPAYDLYALGLLAYQMLSGAHPMEGLSVRDVFLTIMSEETHKLPTEIGVPGPLKDVIEKLLQKDLNKRYVSAQDVMRDLEAINNLPDSPFKPITQTNTPVFAATQKLHSIDAPIGEVAALPANTTGVFNFVDIQANAPQAQSNPFHIESAQGQSNNTPQNYVRRVPNTIKSLSGEIVLPSKQAEQAKQTNAPRQKFQGGSATYTKEHQAIGPLSRKIVIEDLPFDQRDKPAPKIGTLANIRPTIQHTASHLTHQMKSPTQTQHRAIGAAIAKQHAVPAPGLSIGVKICLAIIIFIFILAIIVVVLAMLHLNS